MTVEIQPVQETWTRDYLGGRAMANYLLMGHVPPDCDALGPANALVISAGPAAGTPMAPATATYLTTKSALTGRLACAQLAGSAASELRWAGLEHLIVRGRAADPVWIDVCDDNITLHNARNLWGRGVNATLRALDPTAGEPRRQVLAIGPAAENRVVFATVAGAKGTAAGRTGIGAVLGSKNLKAVALHGSRGIAVKDPPGLLEDSRALLAAAIAERAQRPASAAAARSLLSLYELPPSRCSGRRVLATAGLVDQTLDLGLDVLATEAAIEWLMLLFEKDPATRRTAGCRLDSLDDLQALVRRIASRDGIGDMLAAGLDKTPAIFGDDCLGFFRPAARLLKLYTEDTLDPLDALAPPDMAASKDRGGSDRHNRFDPEAGTDVRGPFGLIPQAEIKRMLWGCAGICPAAAPAGTAALDGLCRLIQHMTGAVRSLRDLEAVAYRAAAVERLFAWNEGLDRDGSRLPADLWGEVRLTGAQWEQIDLDAFGRRLEAERIRSGWTPESVADRKNWTRAGIEDLWPLE
jgi:hypothetical protein